MAATYRDRANPHFFYSDPLSSSGGFFLIRFIGFVIAFFLDFVIAFFLGFEIDVLAHAFGAENPEPQSTRGINR